MYIKSIILDGFKSYGQRTEINDFDHQFTAITGLNGTGKSNILDAICFVLGITNLTHVRVSNLQELIFKNGQSGINRATVTIKFDNTNKDHCPPGYENFNELAISRQIAVGGKNKYMINGLNVNNKKVHDLFCSVQLNVNNPHFLIMQGKITKVLSMKPREILGMIEEAAGTSMYETKRIATHKIIEKKESKLLELTSILNEEILPKIEKLREQRAQFLELERTDRELQHMMGLYEAWKYIEVKTCVKNAQSEVNRVEKEIKTMDVNIEDNLKLCKEIEEEVCKTARNAKNEDAGKLEKLEKSLQEQQKNEAVSKAALNAIKYKINLEKEKKQGKVKFMKEYSKNVADKENQLAKNQATFENLKQIDDELNQAYSIAQKKFEAVSAGLDVNEEGEQETLLEQLMNAKEKAVQANTESQQASMRLNYCQSQLKEKERKMSNDSVDYQTEKKNYESKEKEVKSLEENIRKLGFDEGKMTELASRNQALNNEIRGLKEKVMMFESRRSYTQFRYTDPYQNFDRRKVKGLVGRLIKWEDNKNALALETAAGGRLYNVIISDEQTGKHLLKNGNLKQHTSFIPLNKIKGRRMDDRTIELAQNLVGAENCKPCLSLIKYDRELQPAMEYIFGQTFICKDLATAKKVTFHPGIRKRCVTLDGDETDPAGTLTGGAPPQGGSVLLQLRAIMDVEETIEGKTREQSSIEKELVKLRSVQERYDTIKQKLDTNSFDLNLIKQRLQMTNYYNQQEELKNLKNEIEQLQSKFAQCKDEEKQFNKKVIELEKKTKDSKGYRAQQLKEVESDVKNFKQKAEKSSKDRTKAEHDHEVLLLDIESLKKSIENLESEILEIDESLKKFAEEEDEIKAENEEKNEKVKKANEKVQEMKNVIAGKNHQIEQKVKKKEELIAQNSELKLEIQKLEYDLKSLQKSLTKFKDKEMEYMKKIKPDNQYLPEAEKFVSSDGRDLERRIGISREKSTKLNRLVNKKAQVMFQEQEKLYNDLLKKKKNVEDDKKKLLMVMKDLDAKKINVLKLAHMQVSKDFGSIFGILLPDADTKLVPLPGKSILEGLEIKVALGGIWKDNLTELSGGQRSLAAMSLILAMLLFKPAPLYILDEIDAALDPSHTQNIGTMLKTHFKNSQFIIVSLQDGMFTNANVLFSTKFVDGVSAVTRKVNKD